MWKLRSILSLFSVLLIFSSATLVGAQGSTSRWQTLGGNRPLVIARGGFSGLFADSSSYAYVTAVQTGLNDLNAWCDVQLTSDGTGICFPDIRLNNASDISNVYGTRSNSYVVNGVQMQGWFSLDFTINELGLVNLAQRIYSRAPNFDQTLMPILTVDDLVSLSPTPPPALWLNIPYAAFFNQHNLSMSNFIISLSRRVNVSYISSPEVDFLRNIGSRFRTGPTRLVLQIPGLSDVEPTTNQTYESLLSNLTFVRTFASGIMVPKSYIFPVGDDQYLQSSTSSRVQDAHAAGLLIFASNFVNDASNLPYDYNYDPVVEYLSYVDNGNFSVDGVLSDFPITPSATIDCFAHIGRNAPVRANLTVISNEGASGVYPGCTDRAYRQAISDEAEILDCPVQITTDGVPFCMGSINLLDRTNAAINFSNLASNNPGLNIDNGIFTYNFTWSQIQSSLRPQINNPYRNFSLFRNPREQSSGRFVQLSEFLDLANNSSSVSGVLISVENAAYLAENQGLDVIGAVLNALNTTGNQRGMRIMIQSSDSAVLSSFRNRGSYELVYVVEEDVSNILNSTISDIRNFANSVVISKRSVYPSNMAFITGSTSIVPTLQAFGLQVYVRLFRNEFVSQSWDFLSDAYVELNTFFSDMGINGVITDFPASAARYKRNRCLGYTTIPGYMLPVPPGGLLQYMIPQSMPPAQAPNPVLRESDVAEPPLPPVAERRPTTTGDTTPPAVLPPSKGQPTLVASAILSSIPILLSFLTIF